MTVSATIAIRSRAIAEKLFTYPNEGHESESLPDTIAHYISDSVRREGLPVMGVNSEEAGDGRYLIRIECNDQHTADLIGACYQSFFDIGVIGFSAAERFKSTGKWNSAWEFFLPLGLPMAFARAVEIMDFPPVTLIGKQDYLNSKTTSRWWELLVLNGVTEEEKARYTCILDIVPVAAPANHGKMLDESGIYNGPFNAYTDPLLGLFSRLTAGVALRPLIGLGLPIRKWIERKWNQTLNILDVGTLRIDGQECAAIASNHPAFFYYAVKSFSGTPDAQEKNIAAGLAVMKQDIVAAAWHAEMGKHPDSDPEAVLDASKENWADREAELLELVKKQAGVEDKERKLSLEAELAKIRGKMPSPEELAELEKKFHYGGEPRE